MKTRTVKQVHVYKVKLATTNKDGSFSCPHCGQKLSPDDNSETAYHILETSVDSFGLEEVVIRCGRCTDIIHLTGFPKMQELMDLEAKNAERPRKDDPWFIDHVWIIGKAINILLSHSCEFRLRITVKSKESLKMSIDFDEREFCDSWLQRVVMGQDNLANSLAIQLIEV